MASGHRDSRTMIRALDVRPDMVVRYADKSSHAVKQVHPMVGTPDVLIVHVGPSEDRILFGEALVEVLP